MTALAAATPAPHTWDSMMTTSPLSTRPSTGRVPSAAEAQGLSHDLLAGVGTRLPHVCTAGRVAARLAVLFDAEESALLVAAATLHDVGYSPRIAHSGFHPLDGAAFLAAEGFDPRLAGLVAHHSLAGLTADAHGVFDLEDRFPREQSLLVDALVYADMHSAPDGRMIPAEQRLADIAARHSHPLVNTRAALLRASMARVGTALLALPSQRMPRQGR